MKTKNSKPSRGIPHYLPAALAAGALILVGSYFIVGPNGKSVEPAYREGSFRDFPGRAEKEAKRITLYAETLGEGPRVHSTDTDGNGVFDYIMLRGVPAGHALESVANPASLDSAHAAIMEGEQ